jgi:hypothetical protein
MPQPVRTMPLPDRAKQRSRRRSLIPISVVLVLAASAVAAAVILSNHRGSQHVASVSHLHVTSSSRIVRTGPKLHAPVVGQFGTSVQIVCTTAGDAVAGNITWDRIAQPNGYIPASVLPGGSASASVPECANPRSRTTTPTPGPTKTNSTRGPLIGCNCGVSDLPDGCGPNLSASSGVHCDFANNTFYEYYQATGGDPTQSPSLQVWSPTYSVYIALNCSSGDGVVDCVGLNRQNDRIDVRFTQTSMSVYTPQNAAAYAQNHDLGPNG